MIGYDYLGLGSKHWDINATLRATPEGSAIGCFDSTFGPALPNLKKLLQSGKYPTARIHLWWSDSHIICPNSIIKSRAPAYEKLAKEFPAIKIFLSHSCEHNETNPSIVRTRLEYIESLAPHCIPVNCIWRGALLEHEINEKHGSNINLPGDYITSTDGLDIIDIDSERYLKDTSRAIISFLWSHRFNLRQEGLPLPKPLERAAAPSREYLEGIVRLSRPAGIAPPKEFPGEVTRIQDPMLYKTFAEDKLGQNDPRANRPLLISRKKSASMDIITYRGQVIGKFAYYGGFGAGLYRHYSGYAGGIGLYGYQIAEKALAVSGSEFVWFRSGNKIYGPVNPAFRTGYFR